ncbi:hypothetical protein FG379_001626 [Cryptosporidium bovis]|uniref:uncharacterized protein n=1 Tax=Cryptosporidium bovis TaxID=310047 RepID=UPI00351A9E91|nr:hypothetical protein FG379_001626 [Cryptosporidium bovis]
MIIKETVSYYCKNIRYEHSKFVKFVIVLAVNIMLGNVDIIECLSQRARQDYNEDDYAINFFRKTGKYPSKDYYESNGRYGTPLILKTNDFTLWSILLCVCFTALIIGVGTLLVVSVKNDSIETDINKDNVYDDDSSLLDEYYNENSKIDAIEHLRYLQNEVVKSINYNNPNTNYF